MNYQGAMAQQVGIGAFQYFSWATLSNYMLKIPKSIFNPDLYAEVR